MHVYRLNVRSEILEMLGEWVGFRDLFACSLPEGDASIAAHSVDCPDCRQVLSMIALAITTDSRDQGIPIDLFTRDQLQSLTLQWIQAHWDAHKRIQAEIERLSSEGKHEGRFQVPGRYEIRIETASQPGTGN